MDNYSELWDELLKWIKKQQEEDTDGIPQWVYKQIEYKMIVMEVEYYKNKFNNN